METENYFNSILNRIDLPDKRSEAKKKLKSTAFKSCFLISASLILLFYSCRNEERVKIDLNNTITDSSNNSVNDSVVQIGVAAMLSPENGLPAYEEIVNYIGEKLKLNTKMLFTKDYASMNELVKNKKVIAAFVCSGPYVSGHDNWGMELIAVPELYDSTIYYSYILVNKNSNIKKFEELEGKKFAFTDPKSNTGKLVPTYELARMGKSPDDFFLDYIFTGSHDKSIEAVAGNLVDGAAVDHLIWEYLNNSDSTFTSKTKIIAKLGPFAMPPFVTYPDCDEELKQNIRKILLEMHTDPEGREILDKLLIDKFVVIEDKNYQSIREMNKWITKINTQKKLNEGFEN